MEVYEALESMARNAAVEEETEYEPDAQQILTWQCLFSYTSAEAIHQIKLQRSDYSRLGVSDGHWELIRSEKESQGYDRDAYEHEIEVGVRKTKMIRPANNHHDNANDRIPQTSSNGRQVQQGSFTYLIKLEEPLDTPEKIQHAGQLSAPPLVVKGTGDYEEIVNFCRIDRPAKQAITEWLSRQNNPILKTPTFIPLLSTAQKDLSSTSPYPTLGLDTTLPHHRPDNKSTITTTTTAFLPSQNQYAVWYFFYGTLTSCATLSRVLSLLDDDEPVVLQRASVRGGILRS